MLSSNQTGEKNLCWTLAVVAGFYGVEDLEVEDLEVAAFSPLPFFRYLKEKNMD